MELIDGCLEGVVGDEGLVAQLAVGLGTGAVPVLIGMYVCMGWMDRWMDGWIDRCMYVCDRCAAAQYVTLR